MSWVKCACLLKRYCDLMVRHWRTFCSRIPAVKPMSVPWRHSPSIFLLFLDSHQHWIWIVSIFACILVLPLDGLADDAEAVANGCSTTWSNGMVEGFVNKVKWIKRSSYGQAGFPLLQRRVLLHPAARELLSKDQRRRSSQKSASPPFHETSCTGSTPMTTAAA
jgi:hypothetical protein